MTQKLGKFGIIVSGGPAPGINAVIASVVFTANDCGYNVIGFAKGMSGIIKEGASTAVSLKPREVVDIQNEGGSILRTSRFNPFETEETAQKLIQVLKECEVDKLVLIGGEGTAYLSYQISQRDFGVSVVHIPKTIDNDLILPNQYPSFGFETARFVGTQLMDTIITEARTTNRWFVVKTMGRNAGFLALGLGLSCGASATLIPEQFEKDIGLDDIIDAIMPCVLKRNRVGTTHGTVILAEGIIDQLNLEKVPELKDAPRDAIGRVNFSEVDLEDLVVRGLEKKVAELNLNIKFKSENIGYVLRCARPVSFDIEYTKFLGYGAVKSLLEGKTGIMIVRDYDNLTHVDLRSMADENGRIKSRRVDLNSDYYKVACNFMIK